MEIVGYSIEELKDPTGILSGERYEFLLDIVVDEEDELYTTNGITLKVIMAKDEKGTYVAQYQFIENNTNQYLEFALEEDEEQLVKNFCEKYI